MSNPWFRLYSKIMTDPAIECLAFEDQRHFVWVLCLKNDGVLDKEYKADGMLDRVMSRKLGIHGEAYEAAKARLIDVDLIDENWQPKKWDELQFKSDTSKERMKIYREKQRLSKGKRNGDVTVTSQDTEAEQNRTDKEKISTAKAPPISSIVELYHEKLPTLPRVAKITKKREGYIRQRIREDLPELSHWENYFDWVSQSPFLMGKTNPKPGQPPFRADLEWITNPSNFVKITEEKYHRD